MWPLKIICYLWQECGVPAPAINPGPQCGKNNSLLSTSQVITDTVLSLWLMFICIIPFMIQPHWHTSSLVLSHLQRQLHWLAALSRDRNDLRTLLCGAFPDTSASQHLTLLETKSFHRASKASVLSAHDLILPFYKHRDKRLGLVTWFILFHVCLQNHQCHSVHILSLIWQNTNPVYLGCHNPWKEWALLIMSVQTLTLVLLNKKAASNFINTFSENSFQSFWLSQHSLHASEACWPLGIWWD